MRAIRGFRPSHAPFLNKYVPYPFFFFKFAYNVSCTFVTFTSRAQEYCTLKIQFSTVDS